ncbi:MAG TPA: SUF system NifU family Fe-S cluster assembly protein [bacterium]|nr:SUF system NifU family Fe-S cluster assembly protein [bacterium]
MADSTHDLYREAILEHARNPRNALAVVNPNARGRASNPLCGDELELTLALEGERIGAIGVQVRGCAIAQASASLMSETVKGRTLAEAEALGERFRQRMGGEALDLPAELDTLRPLEAVRQHRSRIACVLLAWRALHTAAQGVASGSDPGGTPDNPAKHRS